MYRNDLVGIVPRCMQPPPTCPSRSTTATDLPCLAACIAAPSPPGPVPITTRSNAWSMVCPTKYSRGSCRLCHGCVSRAEVETLDGMGTADTTVAQADCDLVSTPSPSPFACSLNCQSRLGNPRQATCLDRRDEITDKDKWLGFDLVPKLQLGNLRQEPELGNEAAN